MKKKILVLIIMLIIAVGSVGGVLSASAYVSLEACDKCFQTTMNSLLDSDDVAGNKISAIRKPVYDLKLEHLGYEYEFDVVGGKGFAVIICDNGNYVAQEVMPHSQSPYAEVGEDEQCVYINTMSYYKATEGQICDLESGEIIAEEAYKILEENAIYYENGGLLNPEYVEVTIEYQGEPAEDYYPMSYRTPQFCGTDLTGACAAVAGGNIIGFFDRYYEDLIPNHEAGYVKLGRYFYNYSDTYVQQAIKTLYADMEGTENGISETNFKKGLQKYCSDKSLKCEFTSLKSWGKLDYDAVKTSMKNNQPVALFLNTYHTCDISFGTQKDYLDYALYPGNHVMVGFGYRDTTYTLTSGGTSRYRFIYVATGFVAQDDAYFNIDYSSNIVSAYGVKIS